MSGFFPIYRESTDTVRGVSSPRQSMPRRLLRASDAKAIVVAAACVPACTFAYKMYVDYNAPYGSVATRERAGETTKTRG